MGRGRRVPGPDARRRASAGLLSRQAAPQAAMRLLLDTCVLLWLGRGDTTVPQTVRQALSRVDAEVLVSAATAWEIAIKHGRGRLPLPVPLERFLPMLR